MILDTKKGWPRAPPFIILYNITHYNIILYNTNNTYLPIQFQAYIHLKKVTFSD